MEIAGHTGRLRETPAARLRALNNLLGSYG
jgi:hypothetical protein